MWGRYARDQDRGSFRGSQKRDPASPQSSNRADSSELLDDWKMWQAQKEDNRQWRNEEVKAQSHQQILSFFQMDPEPEPEEPKVTLYNHASLS